VASFRSALTIVGANTLLSRVLGFGRDLVIAHIFGAGAATDAFFVAFKIPNLMRRLFTEGAFALAFVPMLNDYRTQRGHAALKNFVDDAAGLLTLVLVAITAGGILAAPLLIVLVAPGFATATAQHELATALLRLTLPYLLFITLTAFAGSILNTYERFGIPAFTPVLLNLSLIGCALGLAPQMAQPIMALAWGVLLAGLAQLAFQIPFLLHIKLLPRPRLNRRDPGVQRMIALMAPTLLGVSMTQLSLLLDTVLASLLATGSISWLYYANRLIEFPLGIFAATLGTVILPRLAQRHAAADSAAVAQTLDWALRWIIVLGVPATIGLLLLAQPLIATLFYGGKFGAEDVTMASRSLMAYALGLVGVMAVRVLATAYYARHDPHTPLRLAVRALLLGLVCNLALMLPLGSVGLALGTALAATVNAGLLLHDLVKTEILRLQPGWQALLLRCAGANLSMAAVLMLNSNTSATWLALSSGERLGQLLLWTGSSAVVYIGTLLALGLRPRHLSVA
jgi:putative peptidoglycan lipid II flippase